ncbi:hypothetical protein ACFL5T_03040 [Gemmatimonadota bacterium]
MKRLLLLPVAILAVGGCEQATEPDEAAVTLDAPQLKAEVFRGSGTYTRVYDAFITCGADEWAHFVVKTKYHYTLIDDANGGSHAAAMSIAHGTGLGEQGSEWVFHDVQPASFYFPPDASYDRVYNDKLVRRWVGKAQAPSFNEWLSVKWTMNANGEVTVDRFRDRTVCE